MQVVYITFCVFKLMTTTKATQGKKGGTMHLEVKKEERGGKKAR